ncbi:MAG: MerR family transcriptional regulator [Bacteroidetes bacterium]|nr:MerR family transcriptional regulator [bacterium]NBP63851.1 MerR family transcriptional regulator [Bacteroidota bacterium]
MSVPEVHTIKEVSLILDEEQHVLRYWEREFDFLHPKKNHAGNRVYDLLDLAILKELKRLIRTERKTIQEARIAFLALYPSGKVDMDAQKNKSHQSNEDVKAIKDELNDILKKLRS